YGEDRIGGLGPQRLARWFTAGEERGRPVWRIDPRLAAMVSFRQLNLMHPLPMRGPLDAIFCRNVIIYFDKETQRELFTRLAPLQRKDGLLYLGHSESLFRVTDAWDLLGKTVYRRT
ncbi:chemotaxis protein CheR, partial [bacterium]